MRFSQLRSHDAISVVCYKLLLQIASCKFAFRLIITSLFLVVIFLCSYEIATEGMYYAWKEGMTDGDFAFIMYQQSRFEILQNLNRSFTWFTSSWYDGSRIDTIKKAMTVALVLGPVTPKQSYETFATELKKRMSEKPFFSDGYLGMNNGSGKPKNISEVKVYCHYLSKVYCHCLSSSGLFI